MLYERSHCNEKPVNHNLRVTSAHYRKPMCSNKDTLEPNFFLKDVFLKIINKNAIRVCYGLSCAVCPLSLKKKKKKEKVWDPNSQFLTMGPYLKKGHWP